MSWDAMAGMQAQMAGEPSHSGFGTGQDTDMGHSGFGEGGGDRGCFNCGEPGHNKTDCPVPRQFSGTCNSCGKEGHMSKDCPDAGPMVCRRCKKEGHMARDCDLPLVCPRCGENHFVAECSQPMICRICSEEGHMARECPSAPPRVCHNCQEEGHDVANCKAPRKIDRGDVPEQTPDKALELIRQAVVGKDLDDVKAAFQMYVKACPEATYVDMETLFRAEQIGLYLIGLEKTDLSATLTNMDLQGNLDRKYTITFRFQNRPSRPREKAIWPANGEDNMARLAAGGEPVPRGIPLCANCKELGHISRNCPTEKMTSADKATVACYNCGEEGHRLRDCKAPRVDKFTCRNCGQGGHSSRDCTEPRSAEGVDCRNCGETGHFSRDCPKGGGDNTCRNCGQEGHIARDCTEPRKMFCRNCDQEGHVSRECPEPMNMQKMQCRNCDEYGHMSKDCPKPRNMERVQCSNCQQMGHYRSACKASPPDVVMGGDDFGGASAGGFGGTSAGFGDPAASVFGGGDASDNTMAGESVW